MKHPPSLRTLRARWQRAVERYYEAKAAIESAAASFERAAMQRMVAYRAFKRSEKRGAR